MFLWIILWKVASSISFHGWKAWLGCLPYFSKLLPFHISWGVWHFDSIDTNVLLSRPILLSEKLDSNLSSHTCCKQTNKKGEEGGALFFWCSFYYQSQRGRNKMISSWNLKLRILIKIWLWDTLQESMYELVGQKIYIDKRAQL